MRLGTAWIVSSRVILETICSTKCQHRVLPHHGFRALFPFQHQSWKPPLIPEGGAAISGAAEMLENNLKKKKKNKDMKAAGTWQLTVGKIN